MLPFIVSGLVTGAVYGLAGVGLVLTYKTSGVFNFAHGFLATAAAYVFYTLHVTEGLGWLPAAALTLFVCGPVLACGFELLARRLAVAGLAVQVAATVGVLLAGAAVITLIYGVLETRTVPVFLSSAETTVLGTPVQVASLETFAFSVLATFALWGVMRFTRIGVAMRAAVDDPKLLALTGTNPTRVRRSAWLIGVTLALCSGVLFASLLPLDPVLLTLLVVQAFGAAALGAFTSLPLTFAGGLVIGVLASLCTKWFTTGLLAGLPPAVPFILLFVVLLVFPRRRLVESSRIVPRDRADWNAPGRAHLGIGALVIAALVCVPAFAGIHLTDWTTTLGTAIIFLSLGLLVRLSGQVSLCQVSFAAIGVCAFGHLTVDQGWPWLLALAAAGLIAIPIGALLAVPAIRLTGLYLALATFGFGISLYYVFFTQGVMFGGTGAGIAVPRPAGFGGDTAFYYLVLGFAVVAAGLVVAIQHSRLGRLLRAMSESATAVSTAGASVNVTRVLVFCISAFLAAIGGALVGAGQGTVTADSYGPLLSLIYFTLIVIAFGGEPWSALVAAVALILVPSYISGQNTATWLQLLFGAGAVAYAVVPHRLRGLPRPIRRLADRIRRPAGSAAIRPGRSQTDLLGARTSGSGLEVRDLAVRFGGVVAVDGITLAAPVGRITGLIGPNGAGKTTTFNACSGIVRPSHGRILLDGVDVSHRSPSARARRGLGRTFQRMELFESETALANVALGYEAGFAGSNPLRHVLSRRAQRAMANARAWEALELCGIAALAGATVRTLSTGQRRLVEFARCLASTSHVLLLDEPSSGLDIPETERFGAILLDVIARRNVAILIVEHDMSLVMRVCEHLYVLDFGRMLFEGSPEAVRASELVRDAYLGDDALEESLDAAEVADAAAPAAVADAVTGRSGR